MNIFEAIRTVQENPYTVCKSKNMKVMWFSHKIGFVVTRSFGDITAKELLIAEHEDFHKVTVWENVKVDTRIIVSPLNGTLEFNRHFEKFENNAIHYFEGGKTSWTTQNKQNCCVDEEHCRLAAEGEI